MPHATPALPDAPAIHAVAFDMDGLMFNTEAAFNRAGRELLRRRGHELKPEALRLMMGRRAVEAFSALIAFYGLTDPPEELQEEYRVLFWAALEGKLEAMPGLFSLLDAIERRGLPMAVCTSSERAYLQDMLRRFDLWDRFAVTLGAEDVSHGKPDPEIYLTAAERLGVAPAHLLVLEDSENGNRAAAAAGTVAVAVPHEHCAGLDYSCAFLVADTLADPRIAALLGP